MYHGRREEWVAPGLDWLRPYYLTVVTVVVRVYQRAENEWGGMKRAQATRGGHALDPDKGPIFGPILFLAVYSS